MEDKKSISEILWELEESRMFHSDVLLKQKKDMKELDFKIEELERERCVRTVVVFEQAETLKTSAFYLDEESINALLRHYEVLKGECQTRIDRQREKIREIEEKIEVTEGMKQK